MVIDINNFMNTCGIPIVSGMMEKNQIYGVLKHLYDILEQNIEGDIVELGCNVGTTSVFIQKLLKEYGSNKKFHVYDSWEGLPEKHMFDNNSVQRQFYKGQCKTDKDKFIEIFNHFQLDLPIIHSGWFKDIPDEEYPDKICFAFYDGDFYTSIIDSLNKTYHKMEKNGIIIIDDCGWDVLPGVELACNLFLESKKETLEITGYPDINNIFGKNNHGGKIIKL
jgi:O-methyltransferase